MTINLINYQSSFPHCSAERKQRFKVIGSSPRYLISYLLANLVRRTANQSYPSFLL